MGWLALRLRADVRARTGALLAVALLSAIVTTVTLATVAGARRTSTAVERLRAAGEEPDVYVDARSDPDRWTALSRLPAVRRAMRVAFVHAFPTDFDGYAPLMAAVDGVAEDTARRARLVAGRHPSPSASNEVALAERAATQLGADVGETLRVASLSPESAKLAEDDESVYEHPDGPGFDLRVVGIVRSTQDVSTRSEDPALTLLPRSFYERYRGSIGMTDGLFFISLRRGATPSDLTEQLRALYGNDDPPTVESGLSNADWLRQSMRVLASGLLAFAAAVLGFGLAAVAQAVSRAIAQREPEQLALASLGLGPRHRAADAALPVLASAAVGVALGVVAAVAASPLLPLGLGRRVEPDPGVHADAVVLGGGGLALLAAISLIVLSSGRRLATQSVARAGPSLRARESLAARLLRSSTPTVSVGVEMAVRRGRGVTEVAVRTALIGVVLGVAGVAGVAVFASSLDRLLGEPERYGWGWDVAVPAEAEDVARRSETAAVGEAVFNQLVEVNGEPAPVMAIREVKGRIEPSMVSGRAPTAPDEVALGQALRRRLGNPDRVELRGESETTPFRVTGTVVYPTVEDPVSLGSGVMLPWTALERLGLNDLGPEGSGFRMVVARFRPGVDTRRVAAAVLNPSEDSPNDAEPTFPVPPAELDRLEQVRALPAALAALLSALAVVAVVHALLQTVRRRRVDLGVLRAIGFTRSQVTGAMAWQAVALAVGGSAVGLPLGIALGRWVWALVAGGVGVAPDAITPVAVFGAAVAAVAVAALAGLVFGRAAGRETPAAALRAE